MNRWPIHGDPDPQELAAWGLDPDQVLDFSVCVNPYGPSPRVREALRDIAIDRYPDRNATELRDELVRHLAEGRVAGAEVLRSPGSNRRLPGLRSTSAPATLRSCANHFHVRPENILIGNGVSELIWLTCLAFLEPSERVLIPEPTYSEYARSAAMMQATVVPLRTREQDGFHLGPDRMREELRRWQPSMVFLCNPNNPTGNLLPAATIASWAKEWPACLFVIDEAYIAFANEPPLPPYSGGEGWGEGETSASVQKLNAFSSDADPSPSPQPSPPSTGERGSETLRPPLRNGAHTSGSANILVLRSMTKDFALAGLRLGYAVGPLEVIERLQQVQPPWSVNAMAQAAGLAALGDLDHVRRTLALLHKAKATLVRDLAEMGLPPLGFAANSLQGVVWGGSNATNFFLLRVGDGAEFRRSLLEHGILVRDCASFGLPEFVRIATRLPEENRRLIDVVRGSGFRS